jgi:hypothetical protein
MLEYVLGLLLVLVLIYAVNRTENAISWILNPAAEPAPPVTLPIAVADIPRPPPLPLDTSVMAYPSYAKSHLNRLKDTVTRSDGMTMLDTELESKFLSRN